MVPIGVLISGAGRAVRIPVFLLANVGQAVPGIGILALLYVFLGLGQEPTIIALVAYGALPVLRNTVAGIQGVDPAAVEAARGMGMTRWQSMYRVQLPLASPLIFAGLRTSLVLIIGTATLGNFIGGGGLGVRDRLRHQHLQSHHLRGGGHGLHPRATRRLGAFAGGAHNRATCHHT